MRPHLALLLGAAAALTAGCATTGPACPVVARAVAQGAPAPPQPRCPPPRSYPFRNVVLEGGGVKGIAYAGVFSVLDRQGILPQVERVAGTSAGAIQATLLALRYTPDEVRSLLYHLDFKQFEDGGATGLFRFFRRFGWFKGDYYLNLMRCLVGLKTGGNRQATFADLHRLGMLDLRVFSTDLDTGAAKEFSYGETPDFEVALAARMSGSFPLFFATIRSAGDVFVDGGVLDNYPVDAFDHEKGINHETLGFVLENTGAPPRHRPVGDVVKYAEALFEALLSVQTDALAMDPPNLERTVIVNDLGISTLEFELTPAQKLALVEQGEQCTCDYLAAWHRWRDAGLHPGERDLAPGERIPIVNRGKCGAAFD